MTLPTGTVTFLLADVEGSSRLWESGAEDMSASMARLSALADDAISTHGGARPLEQGEGDSFVASFPRASDAVACALDLQLALAKEPWSGPAIAIRVGLHTGEARLTDDGRNYAGEAMNRCARLRNLGHGGQTLLSQSTYELVVERLPTGSSLRDLGSHHLRDLQRQERVWQLCHPDLTTDFPPLRSLEAMPNNLPAQLTSFVGRESEIADVRKLLAASRIVTLTGSGGVGKTRLAVEAAAGLLDEFPDGVWWVDLGPTNTAELAPKVVMTAICTRETIGETATDTILRELEDKRTLIALDNCEHLTEACAELVEQIVRRCKHATILATSRESLGVHGEISWRVPSLGLPKDAGKSIDEAEAVRLFRDRAVNSRPNFRITDANASAVADICRQLEGIPLAIELAAARVRVLTPQQIAAGLSDRFHLLTGGGPRALPRQRTLEASVDWSYNLLTEEERILLRRLSVFAGGCTLDAAEAVCADEHIDAYRVLDLLAALVDQSLVQMEEESEQARYSMLETIRQYAAQRLVDAGEGPVLGDRHLAFYVALAERDRPDDALETDITRLLEALDADHNNLRSAIEWAVRAGRVDEGLRLGAALGMFWLLRGHAREAFRRLGSVLAAGEGDPALRAQALEWASQLGSQVDGGAAVRYGEESLAIAESLGDDHLRVRAHASLATSRMLFDPLGSRASAEQALSLARAVGDQRCEWQALWTLGVLDVTAGEMLAARGHFDAALKLSVGPGIGRAGRLAALYFLGWLYVNLGELDDAERALDEANRISRELGPEFFGTPILGAQADVALLRDEPEQARALLEEVEQQMETKKHLDALTLLSRALLHDLRGDRASAIADLRSAVQAALNVRWWMASMGLVALADHAIAHDDLDTAKRDLDEAFAVAHDPRVPYSLCVVAVESARVAALEGDPERAEALSREALDAAEESGAVLMKILSMENMAKFVLTTGDAEGGVRLLAATDRVRSEKGLRSQTIVPALVDFCSHIHPAVLLDDARARLDGESFERAWDEGWAMSLDDVFALVRRMRGPRGRPSAGWDSLTPREVEVVRLVAQGLSNPDIGERLFLSKRTVQAHLSRIFAKVGVASRAELASEATRRGV